MSFATAIILAAGHGKRLGREVPKGFVKVDGRTLVGLAVEAALASPSIGEVVVAVPPGYEDLRFQASKPVVVVPGGATRQLSVRAGLVRLSGESSAVVCHDAARPLARPPLFGAVLDGLDGADGVVPVLAIPDTVKRVRHGMVVGTEPRQELALAQTPQAFRSKALLSAHQRALDEGKTFTDDAALLEWAGYSVKVVDGDPLNFKVTTEADLARLQSILEDRGAHARG